MTPTLTCTKPILAVTVASALALFAAPAFAVDGLGFDLDGNVGTANAGNGSNGNNINLDWEDLWDGDVEKGDVYFMKGGQKCTFVNGTDPAPFTEDPDTSVAWKGGTKDFNNFDEWWAKDTSASSKSDLINVATAAWLCDHDNDAGTPDHLIMQFVADRASTNGTTFVGFWALQNGLSYNAGTNRFNLTGGGHALHDVLTVTDFQGSIKPGDPVNESLGVYEWSPPGAIKGTIDTIVPYGSGGCVDNVAVTACSIVNEVAEPSIWPFTSGDSGSPPNTHTVGSLVEGAVDLTEATGNPNLCIATAIIETRQSSSVSAILDDLTIAAAPTCGISVTVACDTGQAFPFALPPYFEWTYDGDAQTTAGVVNVDIYRMLGASPAPATDPKVATVLNVDAVPDPETWGPITYQTPDQSEASRTVKVYGVADFGTGTPVMSEVDEAICPQQEADGDLTIEKECLVCLTEGEGVLELEVLAAGKVCAGAANQFPVLSAVITDDIDGATIEVAYNDRFGDFPLDPGECVGYDVRYQPDSATSFYPSVPTFPDTATIVSAEAPLEFDVTLGLNASTSAACGLCPTDGKSPDDPTGELYQAYLDYGLFCGDTPPVAVSGAAACCQ